MSRRRVPAETRQQIVTLAALGIGNDAIAAITGLTPRALATTIHYLRRRGTPLPYRPPAFPRSAAERLAGAGNDNPPAGLAALADVARQRGMQVGALAARILDTIARDNLVDAVLDDGERA